MPDIKHKEPVKLFLNSLKNTRKTTGRIMRWLQVAPDADLARWRLIAVYLGHLISMYKIDFEERIEKVEAALEISHKEN